MNERQIIETQQEHLKKAMETIASLNEEVQRLKQDRTTHMDDMMEEVEDEDDIL